MNAKIQPISVRRRIIYVDGSVQKWLLVALVTFEAVLVSLALWLLYRELNALLEANLYRIHFSESPEIDPLLIRNALYGLGGLIVINVAVLLIVDWFWSRHVKSILRPFTQLLNKVEALDFSEDMPEQTSHKVIELAHSWRNHERQRLFQLRTEIAKLKSTDEKNSAQEVLPHEVESTRHTLQNIVKLLS